MRMYTLLFWDGDDWNEIEEFPIIVSDNEDGAYSTLTQKYLRVEESEDIDEYYSRYQLQYWDQDSKSWNTLGFIPDEELNHYQMTYKDRLEYFLDKYIGFKDTPVWLEDLSNNQLQYLYGDDEEVNQKIEEELRERASWPDREAQEVLDFLALN